MRCIFCKSVSDACVSIEHIVPESLGNKEHVLPKGWVCDTCNNYFAREIEGPFLASLYGRSSRFQMVVSNKRNRIPSVTGFHAQSRTKIEMFYSHEDKTLSVGCANDHDESAWVSSIKAKKPGTLYIPTPDTPDANHVTARFIGKIALEVLAYSGKDIPEWNSEIVDKPEIDELRRYTRTGQPNMLWPVHVRRIYPAEKEFTTDEFEPHQVLHEWMVLRASDAEYSELYVVVAIFGIEYAINLGGPELNGYHKWMKENGNRSPLY